MNKVKAPADMANLEKLIDFALQAAQEQGLEGKAIGEIRLASEEALVNVINYAYPDREGMVEISCVPAKDGGITIEITDEGVPFDPLAVAEPDTTLPVEERRIGGLGIFMIRKVMDRVAYRRENGCNILTMYKKGR